MSEDATCVVASNELGVLAVMFSNSTPELYEIIEDNKYYKEDGTIKGNIYINIWRNPRFYIGPESQEYWHFQDFLVSTPPAQSENAVHPWSYSTALNRHLILFMDKGGDRGN